VTHSLPGAPSRRVGPRRRTRPKRQSDTELARLERRADELCRVLVARRSHRCQICQRTGWYDPEREVAHAFSRGNHSTRWDLDLLFSAHRSCHRAMHLHPEAWEDFLKARWGEEGYYERLRRAHTPMRGGVVAVREIVARLEEQV
jgi:5-methylcytosine-specific restriction endonuclease McrA